MVTADQYFNANSPRVRMKLNERELEPDVPYTILSLQELEILVANLMAGANPVDLIERFCTGQDSPQHGW